MIAVLITQLISKLRFAKHSKAKCDAYLLENKRCRNPQILVNVAEMNFLPRCLDFVPASLIHFRSQASLWHIKAADPVPDTQ